MSQGEARYQRLHVCRLRDCHLFWGEPLRAYHHRFWEQSKADVSHEGEDLSILWGGLGKGQGHEMIDPDHADVRLWGL